VHGNRPLEGARDVVLLVDDEPELRRLGSLVLSRHGFRIELACDGMEGLEHYHRRRDELCLVVTDVVMPKMDGVALARAIREIDAEMPIILISAYPLTQIEGIGDEGLPFLRKPFMASDLMAVIRTAIRK
jgi:two-component system, cell cycle sensor histidine kinase and response regulator CckA